MSDILIYVKFGKDSGMTHNKNVEKKNSYLDSECHVLLKTKRGDKFRFKKWCRKQGFSMNRGLNVLMKLACQNGFKIEEHFSLKGKSGNG